MRIEWIGRCLRLVFVLYLLMAAWQDLRSRTIRTEVFAVFGIAGLVMRAGQLFAECRGAAQWRNGLADTGLALLVGAGLLGLSAVSGQAVGMGDGIFFIVSSFYLGLRQNLALLAGGLLLCFLYCGGLLLWGCARNIRVGARRVPFLPFLVPVGIGLVWL